MLKCARLARLMGDELSRQMFSLEAGGYTSTPTGIPPNIFEIGRRAGRVVQTKQKDGSISEQMSPLAVGAMEAQIEAAKLALANSADRNVAISSANPNQIVYTPPGNQLKRDEYRNTINNFSAKLSISRALAYNYAANVVYELKFSEAAEGIFARLTADIDSKIVALTGKAPQKTASIAQNLSSDNPEDWANAVHSCRRLLQEIADALYPSREDKEIRGRVIKLGPDNYINRLVCFIDERMDSEVTKKVIGSTLNFVGDRLDAVFSAAQKGSHAEISSISEAERYVIYTYILIGDIFSLSDIR